MFRPLILLLILFFSFRQSRAQCPKSEAWVGGRLSGEFNRTVFINQDRINADRFCNGERKETKIEGFSIIVIRNDTIILSFKNSGYLFQRDLKSFLNKIKINDRVLIYDIRGTDYDGSKIQLNPLEYKIGN